jgi:hypothetical protein
MAREGHVSMRAGPSDIEVAAAHVGDPRGFKSDKALDEDWQSIGIQGLVEADGPSRVRCRM